MNYVVFTRAVAYGCLLLTCLLPACQPKEVVLAPVPVVSVLPIETIHADFKPVADVVNLPTIIEYNSDGGQLAHLIYRTTCTYDSLNRLSYITDQAVGRSGYEKVYVRFQYRANRLSRIELESISKNRGEPGNDEHKPGRFELSYVGQAVTARLFIDEKEVQQGMFMIDDRGMPVKSSLKRMVFDAQGNQDLVAGAKLSFTNGSAIIAQQYDTHPNLFSQVREMQYLDALLAMVNRAGYWGGLNGLGSTLNTNNLVAIRQKNCDPLYGCREVDIPYATTLTANEQGFPTELRCSLGAMGYHRFTVAYKQVKN